MKTRWPVILNSVEDLESLDERIRFAMETATRTEVNPQISRKVTSRLIGEKDWSRAVDSIGYHRAIKENVQTVRHYINNGLPSYLKMYNLYQYLIDHKGCDDVNTEIDRVLQDIFGRGRNSILPQGPAAPLDYLYLIHKVDPNRAMKIVIKSRLPSSLQTTFRWRNYCRHCLQRLTAFGRCINLKCTNFMGVWAKAIMTLPSFDYFPLTITCENRSTIKVDCAHAVETLIMNTNQIYGIEHVFDSNGRLKKAFLPLISDLYGVENPTSASIGISRYVIWACRQKLNLKKAIGLPDIA